MSPIASRRHILRLISSLPLLVAGTAQAVPAKSVPRRTIAQLIEESRRFERVSQRIDFISYALLGVRYQGQTLIGGSKTPERFVVRDDAFDCVTFCEVVLAAAIAGDLREYETALRRIRYDQGVVQWDRRNHYFADWEKRNIENGICEPVAIEPSTVIDKTVTWHRAFGRHRVTLVAIPRTALMAHAAKLLPGDIIGFTSRRADLDYFHTGLIAFASDNTLLLRHASQSRGRVLDEKMATFLAANPVTAVTVLRAAERAPVSASH
jgi:N-acetylmuramoyl-L-alanine amidase-like